ncbi:MAG: hypothetical protein ACK5H1_07640, partial [Tenacibaculum sp.]
GDTNTINLQSLIRAEETLTSIEIKDNDNGTPSDTSDDFKVLIYKDENGDTNTINLQSLIRAEETLTSIDIEDNDNGTPSDTSDDFKELIYKDEKEIEHRIKLDASNISTEDVTSNNNSITGVANNSVLAGMNLEVNVDDSTIGVGGDGLELKDDAVTTPKIKDDAVTADKINVNVAGIGLKQNETTGALDIIVPIIVAAGKVSGEGTAIKIYGATVAKAVDTDGNTGGDYQITFSESLPDSNYIIQLTVQDCGGNCSSDTENNNNYDAPGITYYDQQTSGFKVNIGDSDNGAIEKDDVDLEFMFTVISFQ